MKKKAILITIILFLLILDLFLLHNIFSRYRNKMFIEKNDVKLAEEISKNNFTIDKIMLYSSASGINKNSNFQNKHWILDIFEYTDIAIYFSKPETLNSNNAIKTLNISNVNYNVYSKKYSPELYFLDANSFGTDKIIKENKIEDTLEYTVLNSDNNDNSIMSNTPVFFSDLSNPITLKFTNTLLTNYSINNEEKLIFDGSLLTKTPLSFKHLEANLSFYINITNFENEKYFAPINIAIPLENANENIFQGKVLEIQNPNLKLLKQKSET